MKSLFFIVLMSLSSLALADTRGDMFICKTHDFDKDRKEFQRIRTDAIIIDYGSYYVIYDSFDKNGVNSITGTISRYSENGELKYNQYGSFGDKDKYTVYENCIKKN